VLLVRDRVLFHHDRDELVAELDVSEAVVDLEPMAAMGPAAFERLAVAGDAVRLVQEDHIDRLLEQLVPGLGFFQRLVREQACKAQHDRDEDCSENLREALCLFPRIAICHDTPLCVDQRLWGHSHAAYAVAVTAVTEWTFPARGLPGVPPAKLERVINRVVSTERNPPTCDPRHIAPADDRLPFLPSMAGTSGRPWEAAHVEQQPAFLDRTLRDPRVQHARRTAAGARFRGSPLAARMGAAQRRRLTSSRSGRTPKDAIRFFQDTTSEDTIHRGGGCRVQEQVHGY